MSIICSIKQRDYVGGGRIICYRTKLRPPIEELFKNHFEGISKMFEDDAIREKYGIEVLMSEDEKIDKFGTKNDCIRHYVFLDGRRIPVADTSYNDIDNVPFVNVYKEVDACMIECSKNTTLLEVRRDSKKILLIQDVTRRTESFIERFFIDFKNKDVYLYEGAEDIDTDVKEYQGFRTRIIDIDKVM